MRRLTVLFVLVAVVELTAQENLSLTNPQSGLRLSVLNEDYPSLRLLLPARSDTARGIEVEFPEHATGKSQQTKEVTHLYLNSRGRNNKRTAPAWKKQGNTLSYETEFNGTVKMVATAELKEDRVIYTYQITNGSKDSYENLQAVTCVKLYSEFADVRLERTYVHHADGFDLLASEIPGRVSIPLSNWLPCRYLVSYSWPVPEKKVRQEDGMTFYNKSRKVDKPMIATKANGSNWVAATWTSETGNLWTNPERSCHHADPATQLAPGETKTLSLTTFIYRGSLEQVLQLIE